MTEDDLIFCQRVRLSARGATLRCQSLPRTRQIPLLVLSLEDLGGAAWRRDSLGAYAFHDLDNGGRELGQWPPFPLKHFQEKWNP